MKEKLLQACAAGLILLLAAQLSRGTRRGSDLPAAGFAERVVGDTIPDVRLSPIGTGSSLALGATLKTPCTVLVLVDSECKGCREALAVWRHDSTWRPLSPEIQWLLLRATDSLAVDSIRAMDPDARIAGLDNLADLAQLGVTAWPSAFLLDVNRVVVAHPAPFPADIRLSLLDKCKTSPASI